MRASSRRLGRLDGVETTETRPRTTFGTSATVGGDDEGRRRGGASADADVPVGTEAARGRGGEATTEDGGGGGASTSTSVMSMSTSSVGGGGARRDRMGRGDRRRIYACRETKCGKFY